MITKKIELTPIDGRKSFYNKCCVITKDGVYTLFSYDTPIMSYNRSNNELSFMYKETPSMTTMRHINAFLHYFGFNIIKKKEYLKIVGLSD